MDVRLLLTLGLAGCLTAGEFVVLDNGFRIRAERHESIGDTVRLITADGEIELPAETIVSFEPEDYTPPPPETAPDPEPPTQDVRQLVDRAAERYGLPREILHSVAAVESSYRVDALSHKGAIGIMQLMPATAAELKADPHNPEENVDAGARHLRDLLLNYDGGLYRALAAYNAGAGAVERYNGIPPYRETRLYVRKVLERYQKAVGASLAAPAPRDAR